MPNIKMPTFTPPRTAAPELATLFEKAAEALMVRGWTRGKVFEVDGTMCAQGAFLCAVTGNVNTTDRPGYNTWQHQGFRDMERAFEDATGFATPMFNDHVAKKVEDVIEVFKNIYDQLVEFGRVKPVPIGVLQARTLGEHGIKVTFAAGSITTTIAKKSNEYVNTVLADHYAKQGAQSDHELAGGPSA